VLKDPELGRDDLQLLGGLLADALKCRSIRGTDLVRLAQVVENLDPGDIAPYAGYGIKDVQDVAAMVVTHGLDSGVTTSERQLVCGLCSRRVLAKSSRTFRSAIGTTEPMAWDA
jgi:hypothetical protein